MSCPAITSPTDGLYGREPLYAQVSECDQLFINLHFVLKILRCLNTNISIGLLVIFLIFTFDELPVFQ